MNPTHGIELVETGAGPLFAKVVGGLAVFRDLLALDVGKLDGTDSGAVLKDRQGVAARDRAVLAAVAGKNHPRAVAAGVVHDLAHLFGGSQPGPLRGGWHAAGLAARSGRMATSAVRLDAQFRPDRRRRPNRNSRRYTLWIGEGGNRPFAAALGVPEVLPKRSHVRADGNASGTQWARFGNKRTAGDGREAIAKREVFYHALLLVKTRL